MKEIYIPKTIEDGWRAFSDSNIEIAEFEEGITKIPNRIFWKQRS